MSHFRLQQLADWAGGVLKGTDAPVRAVVTDSRTLQPGDLFVALSGPNHEGHDFAAAVQDRAVGVLVARVLPLDCPQIVVDDTLQALQRMAKAWRAHLGLKVAGITGSNGKTSTKEMTAAILRAQAPTASSPGNWNNHIGVPLSLLALTDKHRYAVIEMGANHPGEIRTLTQLAAPDAAAITGAGEAHLEGFGDLDGVAHAKAEIFSGLPADGIAVINAEDRYADLWRKTAAHASLDFAADFSREVTVAAEADDETLNLRHAGDSVRIKWSLAGRHNARNAACAVALALALGVEFAPAAQALDSFELSVDGRLQWLDGPNGARLIDDSYNANPVSFRAAIDVLIEQSEEPWMVMGEMAELGADSAAHHEVVARYARDAGVRRLYALGTYAEQSARAFGANAVVCLDIEQVAQVLRRDLNERCVVLIKASRRAGLERLAHRLHKSEASNVG